MERSLVLVKPDAVQRGLCGTIIGRLENLGLKLTALKLLWMDEELARKHYAPHSTKPFFESLVTYITSGPVVAAVFEGQNAVDQARKAMGATNPSQAETGTIRGDFGLDIEHNTIHGSDSVATAEQEIRFFFSQGEVFNYPAQSD
jgi:nucleoside-diphosphate kinase